MSEEMTREQACDTLRNAAWLGTNEDRERIERAVELLCGEPCEDAISRQAVLDMMQMRMSGKELYKAVYELPSVTPKQEPCDKSITWITGNDGAQIAVRNVTVDKMVRICAIIGEEPCDDAISRRDVLDYIYNDLGLGDEENGNDVERQMELERSYEYVKSLSPVNPQPKTGHWIDKFAGVYRCSCCREIIEIDTEIEHPNGITFNYCPNCGARMFEPQESEEQA